MKRVLVLISPVIFLLFTACGGGDDKAPPPKASCANEESLKNLDCLASIAEQICCTEQSAVMSSYGAYCQAVTNPTMTAGGYTLPAPPEPPPPQAAAPAAIPGCAPSTQPLTCNQAMANFELQFKSTYATCKTAQADAWRQSQGAAVVSCVGASQGITSTDQFYASAQAQCQASLTYKNFSSSAPATITSEVPSGMVPTSGNGAPPTLDGGATPPPSPVYGLAVPPPPPSNDGIPTEPPINGGVPVEPIGQGLTSGQIVTLDSNSIPPAYQ